MRDIPILNNMMARLFIAIFLCMAYCTSYSYGQLNVKISAPTTVTVKWPSNENLLDLSQWFNYLIFVGIVLVAIILIGILLEIFDCSIWCSRRVCNCCGGHKLKNYDPYSGPGYSKKRVCCTGTAIVLVFLIIIGAAGVYAAFNAFFSINIRKLIETGNDVLKGVNGTLNSASNAVTVGLPNAVSESVTQIKEVTLTPANDICVSIQGVTSILDGVDQQLSGFEDTVTYISTDFKNELIDLLNGIIAKITVDPSGQVKPVSDVSFDTLSTTQKIGHARDKLAEAQSTIQTGMDNCKSSVSDIENKFSNPTNNYFTEPVTTAQNSIMQTLNTFSSTLSKAGIDQVSLYVSYVNIADSVRLAVELVIVAAPLLFFLVVTIGICANKKFLFKAPACCIFITFWLFFIVSSLHIAFWIITKDICKEIPARQDTFLSLVGNMTGNPLAQFNTTVEAAAKGVLNCKSDYITEALGGSSKSLSTIRSIIGIDSSLLSSLSSMTSSISVPNTISVSGDIQGSISALTVKYDAVTETFVSDLGKFKTSLKDIKNNAESNFNSSLANAQASNPTLTRDNVQAYCSSHSNADVCKKYQTYLSATSQLTSALADFDKIDAKLLTLKTKIDDINVIIVNDILTAPDRINAKVNEIFASVTALVAKINSLLPSMIDDIITKILTVFTTPLSCTYIPKAINNVDEQFCSGMVLDSIIIGVSAFVIGVLCAIGFILILLIDKYRTYQLKVQNKGKDKPKSEKKKPPVDLLHQIELTEDKDSERAKGAAPALDELPPTYEEASGNFFY